MSSNLAWIHFLWGSIATDRETIEALALPVDSEAVTIVGIVGSIVRETLPIERGIRSIGADAPPTESEPVVIDRGTTLEART